MTTAASNPFTVPRVRRGATGAGLADTAASANLKPGRLFACHVCGASVRLSDEDPLPDGWTTAPAGARYDQGVRYRCDKCSPRRRTRTARRLPRGAYRQTEARQAQQNGGTNR